MKTVGIVALLAVSSLLTCGCGTIANLRSGDPDVYGGIQRDVQFIMTPGNMGADTGILLILAAEVGLSLVGDTLTLPLVIRMRHDDRTTDAIDSAGSDKRETGVSDQENVTLGEPQPLVPPTRP